MVVDDLTNAVVFGLDLRGGEVDVSGGSSFGVGGEQDAAF